MLRTLLDDGFLGGNLYRNLECSEAHATERQYRVVFGCKALMHDGFQEDTSAHFQVAKQIERLRDNTMQFLETMGPGWGRTLEETTA